MKKFVNFILLSGEWKLYHRREFTKEVARNYSSWSYNVAVQYPVSLFFNLFVKFKSRLLPYLRGEFAIQEIEKDLLLFTPLILFHYKLWDKIKFLGYIDSILINYQLNRLTKNRFKNCKKILWVYMPEQYNFIEFIKYDFLIYDMYDDNEFNYDGSLNQKKKELNRKLIRKSNLVICLAESTFIRLKEFSEKLIYIPNGVNENLFDHFHSRNKILEDKAENIVIGYLGTIRNWIDFSLIKEILSRLPDLKLMMVGYVNRNAQKEFDEIKDYPNFIHINHVPQDEIYGIMKKFSVGIIPFKVNNFTNSVFPNKFFEYLSVGLPIISTALPELFPYKNFYYLSKNSNEFLENINKAISNDVPLDKNKITQAVLERGWPYLVKKLELRIQSIVNEG
jgi:hypothetical protein